MQPSRSFNFIEQYRATSDLHLILTEHIRLFNPNKTQSDPKFLLNNMGAQHFLLKF